MLARELEIVPAEGAEAVPLLSVGEDGFAESELTGLARGDPPVFDAGVDRPGPIPVVVAGERGGSRLAVVGSDQFALNAFLREDVAYDHDRDLVVNLLGWLSARDELLGIAARPREHVKLVLRPEQLDRMTWVCLLGLPGFAVVLGIGAWWRRRA